MKPSDIKIDRTLSLTGAEWDALLVACSLALHSYDVICAKYPTKYCREIAATSSCYSTLYSVLFGDAVSGSSS